MSWNANPTATEKNPSPASRSTGSTDGKATAIAARIASRSTDQPASLLITSVKLGVCRRRRAVRTSVWDQPGHDPPERDHHDGRADVGGGVHHRVGDAPRRLDHLTSSRFDVARSGLVGDHPRASAS